MKAQSVVAILLASTVLLFIVLQSDFAQMLAYGGNAPPPGKEVVEAWKVILAALIGALSVYIAGEGREDK